MYSQDESFRALFDKFCLIPVHVGCQSAVEYCEIWNTDLFAISLVIGAIITLQVSRDNLGRHAMMMS